MVGQIRAVGGLHEGGGKCQNYLKMGWNRKEGRVDKDFKKSGDKLDQGVCALKRAGDGWNPFTDYGYL